MSLRPSAALEMHHELLAWWRTAVARVFVGGWNESARLTRGLPYMDPYDRTEHEERWLAESPTYLVTPDMMTLAVHAAASMEDQALREQDTPAKAGLCIFAEPELLVDRYGKQISFAAFSWAPVQGSTRQGKSVRGLLVTYYGDRDDLRDDYNTICPPPGGSPRLVMVHERFEAFNEAPFVDESCTSGDLRDASARMSWQLPLCLWSLMGQTIARSSAERPDRPTRRRLQKAKSVVAENSVTVVYLRRTSEEQGASEPPDGAERAAWTHRWVVSGHWKQQAYGKGRLERKRIWVAPFVKGPVDAPLVPKSKVHVLAR